MTLFHLRVTALGRQVSYGFAKLELRIIPSVATLRGEFVSKTVFKGLIALKTELTHSSFYESRVEE